MYDLGTQSTQIYLFHQHLKAFDISHFVLVKIVIYSLLCSVYK